MGCTKEDAKSDVVPGLRIVQEGMGGNGSKVWVSNTDKTQNGWVPYSYFSLEKVRLRNSRTDTKMDILKTDGGNFYINYTSAGTGNFSACYPSAMYNGSSTSTQVVLQNSASILNYPQDGDYAGKLIVQFPMVAFGADGTTQLKFMHVTGALAFDLVNNTGSNLVFNGSYGGVYDIEVTAKDNLDNPVKLWSTSTNANFTCIPYGNGGINVTNNSLSTGINYNRFYLMKGCTASAGSCIYEMAKNEIIHIVLPIPATAGTKFEITVYKASKPQENYVRGTKIKSRTTPLMTIERNTIYNLGPFYLAD